MQVSLQQAVRVEFARRAALSRELEERLREDKQRRDRETEKQKDKELRDDDALSFMEAVLASESEIAAFEIKLDRYDAATVDALTENEEELAAVRKKLDRMLLEAHTLPDGRRVFKTMDGKHVFDEHGAEIPVDQLAPHEISDAKTRWEEFRATKMDETRLVDERDDLIRYQEKLDTARERLDDPALTQDELKSLEAELGEAMPERVRAKLGKDAPEAKREAGLDEPQQESRIDVTPTARLQEFRPF